MFRQRLNGQVSDLCMTCPGPSQPLDLESHIAFEASLKSAPQAGSQVEVTPRLSEFIEARDAYWKSKNGPPRTHSSSAKWMQRDPSRRKPNQGLSGAVYTVSPDGCWVMETFGSPADMCYVTDRYARPALISAQRPQRLAERVRRSFRRKNTILFEHAGPPTLKLQAPSPCVRAAR
eukprot:TRINITY_DN9958_c0_g1_i6.p1 TRINITY_DN9958_c0_g1~~TRINITY_DN9958_c0_g1_i6.p1  ORF type:complete len:176 (-),score=11.54 TRINITY_DN9958_c0_g1_i6:87-614(-)